MAGKIPKDFIDQLLVRVDVVEVIDRRVPLTKKGKEYQARCPFHDEKTPSFTVSQAKQFYHCFGCGAHGTAIGFLMEYANLSFVEAVEELAEGAGLQVPREDAQHPRQGGQSAEESPALLLDIVAEANRWFQRQLREPRGQAAITYLKGRGLDGRIAADFGIGYAADGWDNLVTALGDSEIRRQQLLKAGLAAKRDDRRDNHRTAVKPTRDTGDNPDDIPVPQQNSPLNLYDRFRNRVIFPIEDHRGRVVAFGGRILGEGEPKYLNSPETPLFHKGAELYGLHRARRAIGREKYSLVVEGYMDVVSLAQFGVDNTVATLGTATTRTHVQRLFRLAPEIVFCFDGDRAGRDAAWKAMQTALPEMRDGRQAGFLFLPDGEDPDSVIRAEGKDGFTTRVKEASPLPDFLLDSLASQVDRNRLDGKARLVGLARPLLAQLPKGALAEMMFARLSSLTGLSPAQIEQHGKPAANAPKTGIAGRRQNKPLRQGQLSPLALATSLLLQHPKLAASIADRKSLEKLELRGSKILLKLLDKSALDPEITTARLLEFFREDPNHGYLEKLATRTNLIAEEALVPEFKDALARLIESHEDHRRLSQIEKLRQADGTEKPALKREMKELLEARKKALKARTDN